VRLEAEHEASIARAERAAAEAEAVVAATSHQKIVAALAAAQASAPRSEATTNQWPASRKPTKAWHRLLASTVLALVAGVGAGMWLGKAPAVSFGLLSGEPNTLRLRLDDTLTSPATRGQHAVPRDRPPSR
jgi:hypothetical protein